MTRRPFQFERSMERDRQRGRIDASIDWESGERVPLRERNPIAWSTLSPCVQSGYSTEWARKVRESAPRPVCIDHGHTEPCGACWQRDRDRLNAEVEERPVSVEAIRMAEAW